MTRYALRFRDGTIQVRRVADDAEIARFQARGDREIFVFGFSPDGRYLATTHFPGFALTVWDIDRRHGRRERPGPSRRGGPRFSPDSRRIALRPSRMASSSSTTWRPVGPAAGGRSRTARTWPSVRTGPRSRSLHNEPKNPTCRILEVGDRPARPVDPAARRRSIGRLEPRRHHPGDAVLTIEDLPLGRRHRHPEGDPRRLDQRRSDRGLPPRRHARWPATAGKGGCGSGTRSWAGPC